MPVSYVLRRIWQKVTDYSRSSLGLVEDLGLLDLQFQLIVFGGAGGPEPGQTTANPRQEETFVFPLGGYWCENHLSVADLDGDGRKDIVLMTTARGGTEILSRHESALELASSGNLSHFSRRQHGFGDLGEGLGGGAAMGAI